MIVWEVTCVYKLSVIRREACRQRDPPQTLAMQARRNEAQINNTVSMLTTSRGTTQENSNPTNVPNTLPSYPTGVNPKAPPDLYTSSAPTAVDIQEKNPFPPDKNDPPHQALVHAAEMALAPADMPPKYSDLF